LPTWRWRAGGRAGKGGQTLARHTAAGGTCALPLRCAAALFCRAVWRCCALPSFCSTRQHVPISMLFSLQRRNVCWALPSTLRRAACCALCLHLNTHLLACHAYATRVLLCPLYSPLTSPLKRGLARGRTGWRRAAPAATRAGTGVLDECGVACGRGSGGCGRRCILFRHHPRIPLPAHQLWPFTISLCLKTWHFTHLTATSRKTRGRGCRLLQILGGGAFSRALHISPASAPARAFCSLLPYHNAPTAVRAASLCPVRLLHSARSLAALRQALFLPSWLRL